MEDKQKTAEKPAKGEKKPGSKGINIPPYLAVMLLILGILGGYAISLMINPAPETTPISDANSITGVAYRTIPVTMVYTNDCKSCRQTNMVEELFKVRQIPYTIKKVEAGSEEGKQILARFPDITMLPTALVDSAKMQFYPPTKKNFDAVFRESNGAYVVPELNLDPNNYYPIYYLDMVPGFCSGDKPSAVLFDDYYNEAYTKQRSIFYDFARDFNESADIWFSFAQSSSKDTNSVLGNLFLMCASSQGKFTDLERTMSGIYCNNPFKGDPTILTGPEIGGCWTLSDHYGKPLTQVELDIALGRTAIDQNEFRACYENKEVMYNNAKKTAQELGITRSRTFLIDCRETASLSELQDSFCARHPELQACNKTGVPDASAPA